MKEPTKPPSLKQPVPGVDGRTLRRNGKTTQFKVWITEALHTEIKVFAAQRRMKLGELVEQAFAMPEIWKEPTKPPSPKQPVPGVDGRTLRRNGKTTQFKVSIPEELHIEIKGFAAQRRMKLGELVEQAFAILKQEEAKSAARLPKNSSAD